MQMELGAVRVVTESREDLMAVLQGMVRHLSNKEIGALLGVSERTVRRWKTSGRLPSRGSEPILLADLLSHLLQDAPAGAMASLLPDGAQVEALPASDEAPGLAHPAQDAAA